MTLNLPVGQPQVGDTFKFTGVVCHQYSIMCPRNGCDQHVI